MKRRCGGYSLVEFIMAMGLATLVLAAVVYISASMIRFSIQGSVRSDVSTWTLFGLSQMNKEIENATHIEKPDVADGGKDYLNGCSNWASKWINSTTGGQLHSSDPLLPDPNDPVYPVKSFYYGVCRLGLNPYVQVLVRCSKTGVCPYNKDNLSANGALPSTLPSPPPAEAPYCSLPTTGCEVIARHVYKQKPATDYYFKITAQKPNIVEMHFTVGVATVNIRSSGKAPTQLPAGSGLETPTPQYLKIDKFIRFSKPYE